MGVDNLARILLMTYDLENNKEQKKNTEGPLSDE